MSGQKDAAGSDIYLQLLLGYTNERQKNAAGSDVHLQLLLG